MSRVLYAWELGAGYGHIAPFHPIAKHLKERGHEVIFVLKNLEYAETLLGKDQFEYLQAPIRWPNSQAMPPAISYSGILKNIGFDTSSDFFARVSAWHTLFLHLQPDLILFDHAPTALLAANKLKTPKALFGNGFSSPPRTTPFPSLQPWLRIAEKELLKVQSETLAAANWVLQQLEAKPLNSMADLFNIDEDFLCTFQELDPYQQRNETEYWDPSLNQSIGIDPRWPLVGTKKIFAYLNKDYPGLDTLLQQLRSSPWSVLVHIPGITQAFIQKYSGANIHISPQPYKLSAACNQCDMAISYGSLGLLASFLLAGKPILVLPFHVEQLLTARNIAAMGAGIFVLAETKKINYRSLISQILSDKKFAQAANKFAEKYTDFSHEHQSIKIANRCEELIRKR